MGRGTPAAPATHSPTPEPVRAQHPNRTLAMQRADSHHTRPGLGPDCPTRCTFPWLSAHTLSLPPPSPHPQLSRGREAGKATKRNEKEGLNSTARVLKIPRPLPFEFQNIQFVLWHAMAAQKFPLNENQQIHGRPHLRSRLSRARVMSSWPFGYKKRRAGRRKRSCRVGWQGRTWTP